jgi:L-threonylcarbamoyladenylate synthase
MKIIKINLNKLDKKILNTCSDIIKDGGVCIVPTDTVYGLIADATNREAIEKIFKIKKRDFKKRMGIFIGDKTDAKKYVKISKEQENLLESHTTLILPLKKALPYQKDTLGIRLPASELLLQLLNKLKKPLVQTSANLTGEPIHNDINKIVSIFKRQEYKPDLILDAGKILLKKPSRVINLTKDTPKVIRK